MEKRLLGFIYGGLAGVIYGLIEYAVLIVAPMYRWRPCSLGPTHWTWEAAIVSIYILLGAVVGGAAGMLRKEEGPRVATWVAVAAALAALAVGRLFIERRNAPNLVLEAAFGLMAVLIFSSAFFPGASIWRSWMCSPWIAVPLIFAVLKLRDFFNGAAMLSVAIVGLWAGVSVAVLAGSRMRFLSRTLEGRFLPLTALSCVVLLTALVSASLALDAPPRIPAAKAASQSRPNVLLVVLDTVRADHLSVYGYKRQTTPYLEALARETVLFRNAISASDMTLSSHGSLFTGLYPSWHGAHLTRSVPQPLDPSFRTLAEILSDNGYTTMAVLANCAYLRPAFGLNQGFDLYDVRTPVSASAASRECLRGLLSRGLNHFVSTAEFFRSYRRGDEITGDALRIFNAMHGRGSPFFLTLNYMDTHDPYIPPPPYNDLFPGRNPKFDHLGRVTELHRELALLQTSATTAADLRHIDSQYDGALAYEDAEVKRLLDGLKQAGLYDNTLIVVTSDHGEALGERSFLGHSSSVHQELVHVPLLVKYPGSTSPSAGQPIETITSGVDIMPTVLDVAGIAIPPNLQGQSLRKLSAQAPGLVLAESFPNYLARLKQRSDLGQRAIYQGHWKYIGSTTGQKELYNLSDDPKELQNLYKSEDPVSRKFSEELDQWLQAIPNRKTAPDKMDRQTRDRLRSLGYIQ